MSKVSNSRERMVDKMTAIVNFSLLFKHFSRSTEATKLNIEPITATDSSIFGFLKSLPVSIETVISPTDLLCAHETIWSTFPTIKWKGKKNLSSYNSELGKGVGSAEI